MSALAATAASDIRRNTSAEAESQTGDYAARVAAAMPPLTPAQRSALTSLLGEVLNRDDAAA